MAALSPRNMAQEFQDPADLEAPEARAPVPNPSGIRIPSTPGSGPPGVEAFDLRTLANVADPGGEVDKVEALEKKVKELEEIIQKMMAAAKMAATSTTAQTHEVTTPGSPPATAAATAQVVTPIMAQTHEVTTPGFPSTSPTADYKDDELKPMHPKDTKPPPEFGGARKDFMPWHESFSSKLRLRSS